MVEATKLSDDLRRFADEIDSAGIGAFGFGPQAMQTLADAFSRTLRLFAIDADRLEADLESTTRGLMAAEGRIAALTTTDHLTATRVAIAIREGVAAGSVIDLRGDFGREQDWNMARHARDDGDAA